MSIFLSSMVNVSAGVTLGGGGGLDWKVTNVSILAENNKGYIVDASGGSVTITLPASPAEGDQVGIKDISDSFGTNSVTISPNGKNIIGLSSDVVVDIPGYGGVFIYSNSSVGWVVSDGRDTANDILVKIKTVDGVGSGLDADLLDGNNSSYYQAALGYTAENAANKNATNGYAGLTNGKIDAGQLPAIAITNTFVVASQAAMLALTAKTGDVAVRTDLNKSYILQGSNHAILGDWQELLTSTDVVQSVAGKTGAVTLLKGDVGLGNVDNTSDANKPVSTAQQTALNLKANLASPTFTGTPAAPTATAGTNTTQIATTAFVTAADNLKANIASPTFTGTPAAPTAAVGTNTTQIATTEFVQTAVAPKAPTASPTFTGTPAAPTATAGTNTTQLATTEFVTTAVSGKANTSGKLSQFAATTSAELAGVISDETGSGALVFANSPTLVTPNIGAATGTSFNSITGLSSVTPAMNGTAAVGTATTAARADHVHGSDTAKQSTSGKDASGGYAGLTLFKINFKNEANTFTSFFTNTNTAARTYTFQNRDGTIADNTDLALKANLASPALTGTPTAPTATAGTNTTQIATTAFVAALGALKANLDSPTFTGTPAAPTAAVGTNTTQLATTAFVKAAVDAGGGGLKWSVETTDKTTVKGLGYMMDTSGGAKTVTLHGSPVVGDTVAVGDLKGTFAINACTITGGTIQGVAEDLLLDVKNQRVTLVYSGPTDGWVITDREPSAVSYPAANIPGLISEGLIDGFNINTNVQGIVVRKGACMDSTRTIHMVLPSTVTWTVASTPNLEQYIFVVRLVADKSFTVKGYSTYDGPSSDALIDYYRFISWAKNNGSGVLMPYLQVGDRIDWTTSNVIIISASLISSYYVSYYIGGLVPTDYLKVVGYSTVQSPTTRYHLSYDNATIAATTGQYGAEIAHLLPQSVMYLKAEDVGSVSPTIRSITLRR